MFSVSDISLCNNQIAKLLNNANNGDSNPECIQLVSITAPSWEGKRNCGKKGKYPEDSDFHTSGCVGTDKIANSSGKNDTSDIQTERCMTRLRKQRLSSSSSFQCRSIAENMTIEAEDCHVHGKSTGTSKPQTTRRSTSDKRRRKNQVSSKVKASTDIDKHFSLLSPVDKTVIVDVNGSNGHPSTDCNSNASKLPPKQKRAIAKRRTSVGKQGSTRSTGSLVNISSLKPVSAVCSHSGLGLVVTYRPVFTQRARKKRMKKDARVLPRTEKVRDRVKPSLHVRDWGTSPRTPSPEKRKTKETNDGFCGRIRAFSKLRNVSDKKQDVNDWLQDISPIMSPRIIKRKSPDFERRKSLSIENKKFSLPRTSETRLTKQSPTPGPSCAPNDFTDSVSFSRRPRSISSSFHGSPPHQRYPGSYFLNSTPSMVDFAAIKVPAASRLPRSAKSAKANTRRTKNNRYRSHSKSALPVSRSIVSQGWKTDGSNSPNGNKICSRSRHKSKGRCKTKTPPKNAQRVVSAEQTKAHLHNATITSRTRLQERSRANTMAHRFSPSPNWRGIKGQHSYFNSKGDDRKKRKYQHCYHLERHEGEDYDGSIKGAGACAIM